MMQWIVDSDHIVHALYCAAAGTALLPYVTVPVDAEAMYAWLCTPDSQGGTIMARHDGPARVKPCKLCIPAPELVA